MSPEGAYQIAFEVIPPPPATPAASTGNTTAGITTATPEQSSSLSTATIYFPALQSSSSGLLGLGGAQKAARSREASVSQDLPSFSQLSHQQTASTSDEASSLGSGSPYDHQSGAIIAAGPSGNQISGNSPAGSTPRKRPLISLPSSVGLASLSGTSSGIPPASLTSKPKSAFRGTNSTFIKAYEGLPLSGRSEKLWAAPEPREVSLAIFTSGRLVIVADISLRAKTRVSMFCSFAAFSNLIG